jgi:hypothetical protein
MAPGFSFWWNSRRESAPARIDNYPTSRSAPILGAT